jgi:hypothetical protein
MAAAEPTVVPIYIPLLVALLPVILSPIVAWALGRSGISKELATIDYLNKRLDFLERLNKLRTQLAEGPIRPFLDTEIEHCEAFLRQPRTFIPRSAEMEEAAPQSRLARFFLTQPAVSTRKRVFRGLFYLFFGFAVLSLPAVPIVLFSEPTREDVSWITILFGVVFYLVIALLFRRAAR